MMTGRTERGEPQQGGRQMKKPARQVFSIIPYASIVFMVLLLTILGKPLAPLIGQVDIAILYLLPVLISAVAWGPGHAALAAVMGILVFDFFFVPPTFNLMVANISYLLSFSVFLLVALLTGTLSGRLRRHVSDAQRREARTAALYALSRDIAATNDMGRVLEHVVRKVAEITESPAALMLPDEQGLLVTRASAGACPADAPSESEAAVPRWAYEHGALAGGGTETLASAQWTCFPLKTEQGTVGVLAIRPGEDQQCLNPERRQMLGAFANLAAVAINRIQLVERARAAKLLEESERLHKALFNSISHELRTPLASIVGAVTGLLDENIAYSALDRGELLQNIKQGALRMNRLVTNLLDMARLESGLLQLKREWCDVQDIIGVAVNRCESVRAHPLAIEIEWNLPMVHVDFVLIEQVIVNLLDNAAKYSQPGQEISIEARRRDDRAEIAVADHGPGIPRQDRKLIFDKFYRMRASHQVSGTGLGLTICRAIVEAHGGEIWAAANGDRGAILAFALPLDRTAPGHIPELSADGGNGEFHG
jgi:two-component system sensor histidine kinase KdpD